MAKDKKSFLLYADLIHTVNKLPNDKAGELFKHVLSYVNDENPQASDMLIEVAFEPIKQSLKRDLEKYQRIVERNHNNGLKGGRPKKAKEPNGFNGLPSEPKKADSDSVNDSDINISFDTFWELYNKKVGKKSKIKTKWNNLKASEREDIIAYIPRYIEAQPDAKFRKNAETFLNNEAWKDEIISFSKDNSNQNAFKLRPVRS